MSSDEVEIGFTGARFGGAPRKRRRRRDDPATDSAPRPTGPAGQPGARRTADEADTVAMPVVGARPGPSAPPPAAPVPAVPDAAAPDLPAPEVGFTGARFGGAPRRRAAPVPAPVPEPVPAPPPPLAADDADEEPDVEPMEERGGRSTAVRPYFYTRGRTRSRYELAVETLVSTPPAAFGRAELAEHRPILELCREPRSIAEVGAMAGMPLGVARVVVGDLAVTGGLVVHRTVTAEGPDLALMERVLSGLRKL
ncbi:DUF742 domain-containing protein [Pseudonocardia ailaonensis]